MPGQFALCKTSLCDSDKKLLLLSEPFLDEEQVVQFSSGTVLEDKVNFILILKCWGHLDNERMVELSVKLMVYFDEEVSFGENGVDFILMSEKFLLEHFDCKNFVS